MADTNRRCVGILVYNGQESQCPNTAALPSEFKDLMTGRLTVRVHLCEVCRKGLLGLCPKDHVTDGNADTCPYCLETGGTHDQPYCRDERRRDGA